MKTKHDSVGKIKVDNPTLVCILKEKGESEMKKSYLQSANEAEKKERKAAAQKLGSIRSEKKTLAARKNSKLGGYKKTKKYLEKKDAKNV